MTPTGIDALRWLRHAVATDLAARHRLTFRHPVETPGNVWCWKCSKEIPRERILDGERCPGAGGR